MNTTSPPDQEARTAIVAERERNVVVIAGAGTGKTKTIIDRAVELLAPTVDGATPLSIQRVAAITFTRRAAGELRFRLRERLLRELEQESKIAGARAQRLRDALGSLDAAFIGTIHGFADRLLRLRPVEADLSPAYLLVEDESELVRETLRRLRRAAEADAMERELGRFARAVSPSLLAEAAETLREATRAGLQMETVDFGFGSPASLEQMFKEMIGARDVEPQLSEPPDPGFGEARTAAVRFGELVAKVRGTTTGTRYLRRVARALRRLDRLEDPADAVRLVNETFRGSQPFVREFNGDNNAIGVFKTIRSDQSDAWVLNKLKGPHRWLAVRLVRLAPVLCAMYERVKHEREQVDYLDLLIKLRNLLRDKPDARRFYRGLFDHIFVDEFQDTDPLQCEIVFYLCQAEGSDRDVSSWQELDLAPGRVTIVGDPKQSIYRFRRADISIYSAAVQRLEQDGALTCRLESNFRSSPELITFFNRQLAHVLGRNERTAFDPASGRAFYEDLRSPGPSSFDKPAVHVVPYADNAGQGLLARDGRAVEAAMWARYIAWLLNEKFPVRDLDSGEKRPVRPGDIAVLACVTTNLPMLLRELDALDIEYAARGGTMFLAHPVVRQFLLALRALADRDDGVAETALLRSPFFALDNSDLVAARVSKDANKDIRRARYEEANDIVQLLRKRRHTQSPGSTARDLIERTALGRVVATGRNGAQTLSALYEVAAEIDRRAGLMKLDYEAVTMMVREWAERPVFLDAAEPVGSDAVRIMTMHGAKGLEFPVTILWDGFQLLAERNLSVWRSDREGKQWAMSLGPVSVEHPALRGLLDREKRFGEAEARRKYYVAATRARDLLAIPRPLAKGAFEYATKVLLHDVEASQVEELETFRPGCTPGWAKGDVIPPTSIVADAELQRDLDVRREGLAAAVRAAATPIAVPIGVTGDLVASLEADGEAAEAELARKAEGGRFGPIFGIAVHRALQLCLTRSGVDASRAIAAAIALSELSDHQVEVRADVERGLTALRELGVSGGDPRVSTEYPVVTARPDGTLVSGIIDLLVLDERWVTVIDFKTDRPPGGEIAWSYPRYVSQLQIYGEMLVEAGVVGKRSLRLGLLFTGDGQIRWA